MRALRQNWINEFLAWIEDVSESPRIFHLWSAATVVGAVAKRNCWITRGDWNLFPNMYTVLVGHTGLGKGRSINPAVNLLRESGAANVLSDKLTVQYILHKLSDKGNAFGGVSMQGTKLTYTQDASCFISSPELEDLIMTSETMSPLKELWEAKDGPFEYGTRTHGLVKIYKPCPTLLGGCTPSQIAVLFPPTAIGGGFVRRCNFVYESTRAKAIPWPTARNGNDSQRDSLIEGLKQIAQLHGELSISEPARPIFQQYYCDAGGRDEFPDEATASYETTKPIHALKLAQSLSIARSDDLVIEPEDIGMAITMVERCAAQLSRVFRAVGDSDNAIVIDRVLRFIEQCGKRHPVTRADLMGGLYRDVGSWQNLDSILMMLETGNVIRTEQHLGNTIFKVNRGNKYEVTSKEIIEAQKQGGVK